MTQQYEDGSGAAGPDGGQRPKIVVLTGEALNKPAGMGPVEAAADVVYTDADGLESALAGAQALLLWDFFSSALRDAWGAADSLDWVHIAAAGVDTVLFDELTESDVVLTNAHGTFDRPIAEYALAAILAEAKLFSESRRLQQQKTWNHRETGLVAGSRVLVVGTGGIGRETARLLSAVGVEVRGAGRRAREDDPDFGTVVASADLAKHAGWADHIVLAAPLTEATHHLVDAEVLAAMKQTGHLINVGRGPLVDEASLVEALRAGRPGAASLDVFEQEPLPAESPLWEMPQVRVWPHMSGDVIGWRDTLAGQFTDNARRWLAGEPLTNVVDKRAGYVPGRR